MQTQRNCLDPARLWQMRMTTAKCCKRCQNSRAAPGGPLMLSSHSERRCSKSSEKNTCGKRTGWKSGPFRIGMRSLVKAGAPRSVPNSVIKSRCKIFGCRPPCPALAAPCVPCAPCEAALWRTLAPSHWTSTLPPSGTANLTTEGAVVDPLV